MKKIRLVVVLLVVVGVLVASAFVAKNVYADGSCPTSPTGLYLYEHVNWGGRYIRVAPFTYADNFADAQWNFNDITTSLCVVGPYRFEVCSNSNYGGSCACFTSSSSDISGTAVGNDQASSAKWVSNLGNCP